MKTLYTHRVYNLSGQVNETVVDLSKVTAIHRAQGKIVVHLSGVRAPLELYEMADKPNVTTAQEHAEAVERAYTALVGAWEAAS
jgi:hypothetical protein